MGLITGSTNIISSFFDALSSGLVSPQSRGVQPYQHIDWTPGTGPNQLDGLHSLPYTLAASPTTIDVTSLVGVGGESLVFARIRQIWAQVADANLAHIVTVGPGASNGYAPLGANQVFPGQSANGGYNWVLLLNDPLSTGAGVGAVVGSTSKTIKLDPGAFTTVLNLVIAGATVL